MWPRENGAWSLLITPFAAALLMARHASLMSVAAMAAALAVFLLREPLLVLARQRWVWRELRPETSEAWRWVAVLTAVLAALGPLLAHAWGLAESAAMGLGAVALTLVAVWMALQNRQRSVWLHVLSCGGLTFTAVVAARSVSDGFPPWSWLLWALCWLQGVAAILVVHTRLDALAARKTHRAEAAFRSAAWLTVGALGGVTAAFAGRGVMLLAAAPALAVAVHTVELARMNLETKLKVVGMRAMALSIVYALIIVWALS